MNMKKRLALACAALALFTAGTSLAADLYWSANGNTQGGAGTWNTTSNCWGTVAGGPYGTAWNNANNDVAIFGNTAGTVTLGEGITVGGLVFNTASYTVTANTLTFGAAGIISNAVAATISSAIAGTGPITKDGAGTLTLSGTNSYSGATTISAGTLALGASSTLPASAPMSIAAATLNAGSYTNATGALTLTGNATINLANSDAQLAFASSSAAAWGANTLTVTGVFVPGYSLRFGTTSGGLTVGQLAQISITGWNNLALDNNGYLTATSTANLWTPAQITTALWLDASDSNTVQLSGSSVTNWIDKSGNGRNASQGTAANQPTYQATGISGKPALSFDGGSDVLNFTDLVLNDDTWVISVYSRNSSGINSVDVGGSSLGYANMWYAVDDKLYSFLRGTSVSYHFHGAASTATGTFINGMVRTSLGAQAYRNGTALGGLKGEGLTGDITLNRVGYGRDTPAYRHNGAMGEILVGRSVLSTSNRQKLEGYLAWKWGTVASLPSGHPYKNRIPVRLTWDADGATAGQTDGAGDWTAANQWWDGAANVTWTSGLDAIFGNGGTGGAVTLAAPTTIGSLTLNSFSGSYTLGSAGQTITLDSGLAMNAGAGAVTILSPLTLGGAQSWTNDSGSLLTIGTGVVNNGGFLLTLAGSGTTTVTSAISGTGGLSKSGAGTLKLGGTNTYNGVTIINNGTLAGVTGGSCSNSAVTVTNTTGITSALAVVVTNSAQPWVCSSLTVSAVAGGASQVKFSFGVTPSLTQAPLVIRNTVAFSGSPTLVVDPANLQAGKKYPLLTVGGTPPGTVPALSLTGMSGTLGWEGNTLYLAIPPSGTLILFH
jgi:autotransporter-associated beta strand protein